jgi:hypothetical protein
MKSVGLPFSGQHSFVSTEMTLPLNHMVAPKEQAVACTQCHTRGGSRLASLTDFYLPGRDRNRTVDALGTLAIAGVLGLVALHGGVRGVTARRRRRTR